MLQIRLARGPDDFPKVFDVLGAVRRDDILWYSDVRYLPLIMTTLDDNRRESVRSIAITEVGLRSIMRKQLGTMRVYI